MQARIVGGRRPVLAAHVARTDDDRGVLLGGRRGDVVDLDLLGGVVLLRLAGLRVQAGRPRHLLDERHAPDERAGGAVERVGVAVPVRLQVELLHGSAAGREVDEHVLRHAVVVERVVRRVLEAPPDLPGVRVHRQGAVGVEVVARAILRVPVRARVAGAPVQRVGGRVVAAGHPGRAAARRGRVLGAAPRLHLRIGLARDRVRPPDLLLRRQVRRREPAADAELAAGDAGDRHVLHDQRRPGDRLALVGIGDLPLPDDLAGLLVRRDQAAVQRVGDHEIAPQRDAAVVDAAARDGAGPVVVGLRVHLPDQRAFAAVCVDLVDRAPAVGDVEEAVLGDRRALEAAMRPDAPALDAAKLHGPGDVQALDVGGVDLVQVGEAVRREVLVMQQPVPLLLVCVHQAVLRHLVCRARRRPGQQRERGRAREQNIAPTVTAVSHGPLP